MENENQFGLKHKSRHYQCSQCGHQQNISTNHTTSCADICKNCSWKPSQGIGHKIPALGGSTYRKFVYVGHLTEQSANDLAKSRQYWKPK
jgi:hypothetical protein